MVSQSAVGTLRTPQVAFAIAIAVSAAVRISPVGAGDVAWMLAITAFCITLWVLSPIPPAYTRLIGIGLIT